MISLEYTLEDIYEVATDVTNTYKKFKTLTFRQDGNELYLIAINFDDVKEYLRYTKDGTLSVKYNGIWSPIQSFSPTSHLKDLVQS